jgi:hypothetical protein
MPACDEMGEDYGTHGGVWAAIKPMKVWLEVKERSV